MIYTHAFDLLAKVVALIFTLVAALAVDPDAWAAPGGVLHKVAVVAILLCCAALTWLLVWRPVLLPASTWAYARWTFQVSPTWREAHELRRLFAIGPAEGLRWHPSLDVRAVERQHRLEVLLARVQALNAAPSLGWWESNRRGAALGRLLHPHTYLALNVFMLLSCLPVAFGVFARRGPMAFLSRIAATWVGPTLTGLGAVVTLTMVAWSAGMLFDRLLGRGPPPLTEEPPIDEPVASPSRNPFA